MPITNTADAFTSRLISRQWLTEQALEIELARPPSFDFIPGQCIRLAYKEIERYYSISSAPSEQTIRICAVCPEDENSSAWLADAKTDTRIVISGPVGYFTFAPSERSVVFVATGSGIAPFLSMARSGVNGFTMFQEVTGADELYYDSFFRTVAKQYTPCLMEGSETPKMPPDTFGGSAAECLQNQLSPACYDFYLCGRQEMIRDVTHTVDKYFPDSFVFKEVFC